MSAVRERLSSLVSAVRFGKFVSVGVVGAVFDNAVLAVLTAVFGVTPELAKFAGIETAIVVMFLVNDRWTFADQGARGALPMLRRLLTSNLVRAGGIVVQLVVFSAVYRWFHVDLDVAGFDLWLLVASVAGIGAGMVVNYVTESLVTWRVHDAE